MEIDDASANEESERAASAARNLAPSALDIWLVRWGAARLSETSGCGKLNRNRRYRDDSR